MYLAILTFVLSFSLNAVEKPKFISLKQKFIASSNLVEDEYGYILISKNDGIYKYDGSDFLYTSFESVIGEQALKDRGYKIVKDNNHNLWVTSYGGILARKNKEGKYNIYSKKGEFKSRNEYITQVLPNNNEVWFSSSLGSVYKYNQELDKVDSIFSIPSINGKIQGITSFAISGTTILLASEIGNLYSYDLKSKDISEIDFLDLEMNQHLGVVIDKNDNFWISTEVNGVFKINPEDNIPIQFYYPKKNSVSSKNYPLFISIYCDSKNNIWLGTDGDGLYSINTGNGSIVNYKKDDYNRFSISTNTILHIYEDTHQNMWFVGKMGKIDVLSGVSNRIGYHSGHSNNIAMRVLSVLKAQDSTIWIGSDGYGLNRYRSEDNSIQYSPESKGDKYFAGQYIQGLKEDNNGNIWVATYKNGLWLFDNIKSVFKKIKTQDSQGNYSKDIRSLYIDSKNRIWAASGLSVNVYSEKGKILAIFDNKSHGMKGVICNNICEDENKNIWVSIQKGGLFSFKENDENISQSHFEQKQYFDFDADLKSQEIDYMVSDMQGSLWMSTSEGYINKYNINEGTFLSLKKESALYGINVSAILIDDESNLWLSSRKGIHNYNIKTKELKSHYDFDGLQGNSFVPRSAYKDNDGMLYFGGDNGMSFFRPSEMKKDHKVAKLFINSIDILNKPGKSIIPDQLWGNIEDVEQLSLKANQSSFSFEFSAISNVLNTNYNYSYKLEGFDDYWIKPKRENIASYTNIPAGDYVFKIRAGSKQGLWDVGERSIKINIKPVWWLSSVAYVFYALIIALILYAVFLWTSLKNRLQNEAWENKKEKELHSMKMSFFAKMSHEIQTPLTLILGPIDEMLDRAQVNKNQLLTQRLTIIKNNAERLSRIANDLMTVRNHELGIVKIQASNNDIIADMKKIALAFEQQARFKNIDFSQLYEEEEIKLWYDKDKLEHVFYNLLSNAFKFTPSEGNVKISVFRIEGRNEIKISVSNSGSEISEKELKQLFKLFYRTKKGASISKGTGIGLAFAKEMIDKHKGDIEVESSLETGTKFTVTLSTDDNLLGDDEKVYQEEREYQTELSSKTESDIKEIESSDMDKKHTLLVVEDNVEMQIFLKSVLETKYKILLAENGKAGIEMAEKNHPDLIISDIMMPVMDGMEMGKHLQGKKSTSHIPIIMLTAKNSVKYKIDGLEIGVLEVMRKPFSSSELHLKVKNVLEQRERIISRYKKDVISSKGSVEVKSKDDIFLENLVKHLNDRLEDPDFKLEELSNSMNMSYSVVYRRCNEVTGKTLVEFVRTLKLRRAAVLILNNGYNISEASYMVGYKDSKYFTKCFKDEFSITPFNMKKEKNSNGLEETLSKYELSDDSVHV